MGGDRRPAFQFYPNDWQADSELKSCSLAARGLWMEIMCIMHSAEPYGHLVTRMGEPLSMARLSRVVGSTEEECIALIDELEDVGVFSRTQGGAIYSRRMVADFEKYQRFVEQKSAAGKASAAARATGRQRDGNGDATGGATEAQREGNPPVSSLQSPPPDSNLQTPAIAFGEFWSLTVRKAGKEEARLYWDGKKNLANGKRMTEAEREAAMKAYPLDAAEWKRERREMSKIPHPRTWLYNRRYMDRTTEGEAFEDDLWMYESYRTTCYEEFKDHSQWDNYIDYACQVPQRQSLTFREWLKKCFGHLRHDEGID